MPPKKPIKPIKKAVKSVSAGFKPLPEATPRYVAPPPAPKPVAAAAPQGAPEWDLALRFWWAQLWRTLVVVIPGTLILQVLLALLFSWASVPLDEVANAIIMGLTLAFSVALQVAVVRHMLRKKTFKGFTFTLKERE
jgi:hypothetical protein